MQFFSFICFPSLSRLAATLLRSQRAAAAAKVALPPSCHIRHQAGRRCRHSATAALLLATPLPRCHSRATAGYATSALPTPPMPRSCQAAALATKLAATTAALPPPTTPRSCQAAASATKLAAPTNATLLPSCRHRRQAGRHPPRCRRASAAAATATVAFDSLVIVVTVIVADSDAVTDFS